MNMRLHERQQPASIAGTQLAIALHQWQWDRVDDKGRSIEIDDVEMLRLVTLEIRNVLLDMEPAVRRAETHSSLKDLIMGFKTEQDDPKEEGKKIIALTDIELLQALFSYCQDKMKWMLRYERHGNYETPAGWDN